MSRVTTSNYGAEATTQFAWATTDDDLFDRESDLYHLAQALENHTHGATRGLAVARLATGAVDAAAIGALQVETAALANLSVTNGKLAAGAVTFDKVTMPWIQVTNDFAGGFRLEDSTTVYQSSHYIAANGLAVFGAGTIVGGITSTALILGQAGQATIGAVQGAAKFNVMQTATTVASGFRLYNTNQAFYLDMYSDATATLVMRNTGGPNALFMGTTGYMTIGAANNGTAKLTLVQGSESAAEGFQIVRAGGTGNLYVLDAGPLVVKSVGTSVQLEHSVAALSPLTTGGASLGTSSNRWSNVYTQNLNISGTITGAGSLPLNGVIWFPTLADLTAAGASWARYTAGDGRLLIGAGTTFSQTFAEATPYGANWTPSSGLTNSAVPALADGQVLLMSAGATTNMATSTHTHPAPTINGSGTAWLPPMRAGIWGQRIS